MHDIRRSEPERLKRAWWLAVFLAFRVYFRYARSRLSLVRPLPSCAMASLPYKRSAADLDLNCLLRASRTLEPAAHRASRVLREVDTQGKIDRRSRKCP